MSEINQNKGRSRGLEDFQAKHTERKVLVTGATGYVGGRLIPELLSAGFSVRAASRKISSLERFDWFEDIEPVEINMSEPESLTKACEGIDTFYYLVHSMGSEDTDFEDSEKEAARNVAVACETAKVRQIIYLSGLHPSHLNIEDLSKHMRSRERVAQILQASQVPTMVLRAATLIGSGSASYEIIRGLAERLPLMVAPQWIKNKIEPLAIRDALYYLVRAADLTEVVNRSFDVGCGKQYTFADLIRLFAQHRGYKRFVYGFPIGNEKLDKLSGFWISIVTPVPLSIALPLAQSMAEDAVCEEHDIAEYISDPKGGLTTYEEALKIAAERELNGEVVTSWDRSWTLIENPANPSENDPDWAQPDAFKDVRLLETELSPAEVWPVIEGIGGSSGWYSTKLLWDARGYMDKAIGGPGLGGRRDPRSLRVADRLDWWRVESLQRPYRLVLRAEMKVSGRAWLIFELEPRDGGGSRYKQTAVFLPQGIRGRLYWYSVLPFHSFIFPTMARRILSTALQRSQSPKE